MAEFHFLGTWDDSWNILNSIIEDFQPIMYPDVTGPLNLLSGKTVLDENFKAVLKGCRRTFLWSASYSKYPVGIQPLESSDDSQQFFIYPSEGGPVLDFTFPPCFEHNGIIRIGHGSICYDPQFRSPELADSEPSLRVPEELKTAYKNIVTRMKKCFLKKHQGRYAGHDAISMIEACKAKPWVYYVNLPEGQTRLATAEDNI